MPTIHEQIDEFLAADLHGELSTAEQNALHAHLIECAEIPFGGEIAHRQGVRLTCGRDFVLVDDHARALEKCVAAAVIRMQVRQQHDVDRLGIAAGGRKVLQGAANRTLARLEVGNAIAGIDQDRQLSADSHNRT